MKHQHLAVLRNSANIVEAAPLRRRDKIAIWAQALDALDREPVNLVMGIEYLPDGARDRLRGERTPFTVAYADPRLRNAGLKGDTYGVIRDFFELDNLEMHRMFCGCHLGERMEGRKMAGRVRRIGDPFGGLMRLVSAFGSRFA